MWRTGPERRVSLLLDCNCTLNLVGSSLQPPRPRHDVVVQDSVTSHLCYACQRGIKSPSFLTQLKPRPFQNTLSFVFAPVRLTSVASWLKKNQGTNCHQCQSTTLDATSATDAWRGKPLPLQARTESSLNKQGKTALPRHITSAHSRNSSENSMLWRPFQDGKSAQTLQHWPTMAGRPDGSSLQPTL